MAQTKQKKRRQYGSGSFRLRGNKYYIRFYNPASGIREEEPTEATTEPDAKAALNKRLAELRMSAPKAPRPAVIAQLTVADLIDRYVTRRRDKLRDTLRSEGATDSEIDQAKLGADEYMIDTHLRPFFSKIKLKDFHTSDTVRYRDYRRTEMCRNGDNAKQGTARGRKHAVSHSSIDRELRILRAAINKLWRDGDSLVPNLINVSLENVDNVRKGFITPVEFVQKFQPALYQPQRRHVYDLVTVLFTSGMRTSEALNLEWKYVDVSDTDTNKWSLLIIKSKNGDQREVPIFDGLMREAFLRLLAQREIDPHPYVFQEMRTFNRSWKSAVAEAKLTVTDLRPHDLRRSAAKNMRNAGILGPQIMQIMGHKSINMLLRYNIIDANDIQEARNQMNASAKEWSKFRISA
jgi:integrase